MPPTDPDHAPDSADPAPVGEAALESMLARIQAKPDFPALSQAIRRIGELTRADRNRVDNLADAILQDFSLTTRILRLVNSSTYRTAGQEPIATMTRAVMLLGIETIRSLAVSLTLFEHMADRGRAQQLREELVHASLGGAIARALAEDFGLDSEEAWLCGMFQRLGRMLALYHFPEEADRIGSLTATTGMPERAAARQVLGASYEQLGMRVARLWGFPASVVSSMSMPAPNAPIPRAFSAETRLNVLSSLSAELIEALENRDSDARDTSLELLGRRYGRSVGIGAEQLGAALSSATRYVSEVADAMSIDLKSTPLGRRVLEDASVDAAKIVDGGAADDDSGAWQFLPSDASVDGGRHAKAILTGGLDDLTRALEGGCSISDAIHMAMEVLHRGLSTQRVIFALRDPQTNQLIGRHGIGAGLPALLEAFRVPIVASGDIFSATAIRGADLLITDAHAPNVATHLPGWHREFSAGSFLLLPIAVGHSATALIYCDHAKVLERAPDAEELTLVREIRDALTRTIHAKP